MYIDKFDNAKFCFEYSGIEIILQKHFALEVWFSIHVQCNAQLKKADKSVDELPQNISSKNVLLAFDIKT